MFLKSFIIWFSLFSLFSFTSSAVESLSTPVEAFSELLDYPFSPNFVEVDKGLNMHYIDEGNKDAPVILLLHGMPSWSYMYRHYINSFVEQGFRVVAPDLIGFGKSDKLRHVKDHNYLQHVQWLKTFIQKNKLKNINLFGHDWGGVLGLRLVASQTKLFNKVSISYAYLFTGTESMPKSFRDWQKFVKRATDFSAGQVMNWGTNRNLSVSEVAAYNAPFPDESYKVALRQFPFMFPESPLHPDSDINFTSMQNMAKFNKPFLTIWGSTEDAMWQGKDEILFRLIPGAKKYPLVRLESNHFVPEDNQKALIKTLLAFFNS
jgi:haloalkane dehalogenase